MDQHCHGIPNYISVNYGKQESSESFHQTLLRDIDNDDLGRIDVDWFASELPTDVQNNSHESNASVISNVDVTITNILFSSPFSTSEHKPQDFDSASNTPCKFEGCVSPICATPKSSDFKMSQKNTNKKKTLSSSTPRSLSVSLGADLGCDAHLWSTSMETPVREICNKPKKCTEKLGKDKSEFLTSVDESGCNNSSFVNAFKRLNSEASLTKDDSLATDKENHCVNIDGINETQSNFVSDISNVDEQCEDYLEFLFVSPPRKKRSITKSSASEKSRTVTSQSDQNHSGSDERYTVSPTRVPQEKNGETPCRKIKSLRPANIFGEKKEVIDENKSRINEIKSRDKYFDSESPNAGKSSENFQKNASSKRRKLLYASAAKKYSSGYEIDSRKTASNFVDAKKLEEYDKLIVKPHPDDSSKLGELKSSKCIGNYSAEFVQLAKITDSELAQCEILPRITSSHSSLGKPTSFDDVTSTQMEIVDAVCAYMQSTGDSFSDATVKLDNNQRNYSESSDLKCKVPVEFSDVSVEYKSKIFSDFCTASGNKLAVSKTAMNVAVVRMENSDEELQYSKQRMNDRNSIQRCSKQLNKSNVIVLGRNNVKESTLEVVDDRIESSVLADVYEILESVISRVCGDHSAASCESEIVLFEKHSSVSEIKTSKISFSGFTTATGKGILVSDRSSNLAELTMEDIFNDGPVLQTINDKLNLNRKVIEDEINNSSSTCPVESSTASKQVFTGFSTASGNKVSVSTKSIRLANHKMDSIDGNSNSCVSSFTTASGKNVSVSKKAVPDAESLMKSVEKTNGADRDANSVPDGNKINVIATKDDSTNLASGFPVFLSASGKNISISDKSVNNIKSKETSSTSRLEKANSLSSDLPPSIRYLPHADTPKRKQFNARGILDYRLESDNPVPKTTKRLSCEDNYLSNKRLKIESNIIDKRNSMVKVDRTSARQKQTEIIESNNAVRVKVMPGSLFTSKMSNKMIKLRDAVDQSLPRSFPNDELLKYGVKDSILKINSSNAANYKFLAEEQFSTEVCSRPDGIFLQGAMIVLSDDNTIGKEELFSAFLTVEGVDQSLITDCWFYNHYRWVVWKLSCLELKFPIQFGGCTLNPGNVLRQLKFRYDREIDNSQRSALKKILERDDVPNKTIVLCVCNIFNPLNENGSRSNDSSDDLTIELTDGWYSITAALDDSLRYSLTTGKLMIGQKIIIHGAELIGSDEACSPLDALKNLRLRIHGNSARRGRWDMKLGFYRNPWPFLIPLCSIKQNGGNISCLDVTVVRVYPMLYFEKLMDGSSVFRVSKSEEKMKKLYDKMKDNYIEKTMKKIKAEYFEEKQKERGVCKSHIYYTDKQIENLKTGEEIHAVLETSSDPDSLLMELGKEQIRLLQEYQQTQNERDSIAVHRKLENALQEDNEDNFSSRKVTPLLRVRIVGCHHMDQNNPSSNLLNVWQSSPELENMLQEGASLRLYNVMPSGGNYRKKYDKREGVSLSTTRMTRYESNSNKDHVKAYPERYVMPLLGLSEKLDSIAYREVDIVFFVVDVVQFSTYTQTVYICDEEQTIAALKFPGGPQVCGAEDVIKSGSILCACNVHVETYAMFNGQVPCLVASDRSVFFKVPRTEQRQTYDRLQSLRNQDDFNDSFREKWENLKTKISVESNTPKINPYRNPSILGDRFNVSFATNKSPRLGGDPYFDSPTCLRRTNAKNVIFHQKKLYPDDNSSPLPPIRNPVSASVKRKFKPPQFTPPTCIKKTGKQINDS